mmetsp:Transcript_28644/g.62322  ORF Transcript_28644/g.62322 Transcript_28644/m.62322 type:complete len:402 (+) Transcript_28644:139-1344(+)|eukprot:CAMPEP_0206458914 /NCGR_PEP_ID=MMETSP0324_2-20121206/23860_1 /ASSEMBLY_ACC=CAM_ASM_000836 /TAXON_ID=2866 /ORGANISM="Crypthecodinium cohnii, Strain Seligo" /LENGTH=401 /DNA_ID=CAMNT_0053930357 /DNA_START=91 /DNA_END=1296 /DNA_ORIENTATION=-
MSQQPEAPADTPASTIEEHRFGRPSPAALHGSWPCNSSLVEALCLSLGTKKSPLPERQVAYILEHPRGQATRAARLPAAVLEVPELQEPCPRPRARPRQARIPRQRPRCIPQSGNFRSNVSLFFIDEDDNLNMETEDDWRQHESSHNETESVVSKGWAKQPCYDEEELDVTTVEELFAAMAEEEKRLQESGHSDIVQKTLPLESLADFPCLDPKPKSPAEGTHSEVGVPNLSKSSLERHSEAASSSLGVGMIVNNTAMMRPPVDAVSETSWLDLGAEDSSQIDMDDWSIASEPAIQAFATWSAAVSEAGVSTSSPPKSWASIVGRVGGSGGGVVGGEVKRVPTLLPSRKSAVMPPPKVVKQKFYTPADIDDEIDELEYRRLYPGTGRGKTQRARVARSARA